MNTKNRAAILLAIMIAGASPLTQSICPFRGGIAEAARALTAEEIAERGYPQIPTVVYYDDGTASRPQGYGRDNAGFTHLPIMSYDGDSLVVGSPAYAYGLNSSGSTCGAGPKVSVWDLTSSDRGGFLESGGACAANFKSLKGYIVIKTERWTDYQSQPRTRSDRYGLFAAPGTGASESDTKEHLRKNGIDISGETIRVSKPMNTKDIHVDGSITTTGGIEAGGDIHGKGNLTIDGDTHLKGNAEIDKDLTVHGNQTVDGDSLIHGNQTIDKNLHVKGDATLDGKLDVGGDTHIHGSAEVDKDLTVHGDQTVDGDSTIHGDQTIDKNLHVKGDTTLDGKLDVGGDSHIHGDVEVDKDLAVHGNQTVDGDSTIHGNQTIDKDLHVKGDTTLDGKLDVTGDTHIKGNTEIDKDLIVHGNQTVDGDSTIHGSQTIDKNLTVKGDTDMKGNARVEKDLTVNGNVEVDKNLHVKGDTRVDGDIYGRSFNVGDERYIDKDGINANNHKIRNVADGDISSDSLDAVNGRQLYHTREELRHNINQVSAQAAAMANLHPIEYNEKDKVSVSAAVGGYKDQQALAIGAYYRPNKKSMISLSGTLGNNDNMYGIGFSQRFGEDASEDVTDRDRTIRSLQEKVAAQDDQLKAQLDIIQKLQAQIKELSATIKS